MVLARQGSLGNLSRQPSEMGRWKTFSREPAEFLAGKGEERRGGSL